MNCVYLVVATREGEDERPFISQCFSDHSKALEKAERLEEKNNDGKDDSSYKYRYRVLRLEVID